MGLCGVTAKEISPAQVEQADWGKAFAGQDAVAVFYTPSQNKMCVHGADKLDVRYSPCSTFKIISTLMGLDAGVLKDQDTKLGYDGTQYEIPEWNKDVTLTEAFKASCVWYYKKLVSHLTKEYVQGILQKLKYGNENLCVWNNDGHHVFWIESCLQISAKEQVLMLEKLIGDPENSPFQPKHTAVLVNCMRYPNVGDVAFYAKTGTGRNHKSGHLEAWCVGFCDCPAATATPTAKDTNPVTIRVYFAVHAADPKQDVTGPQLRDNILPSLIPLNAPPTKNLE